MGFQGPETAKWYRRGTDSLVKGTSSMFRYWSDDDTMVIARGEGGAVFDMDGKRYVDYQLGFGPVILGHGRAEVVAAVAEAAADGTTFAMTQRREIEAAEAFKKAVPWVEHLRFTNTGTEATMHAIRLARGFTDREVVVKFEGQYHGVHDTVMFSTAGAPPGHLGARTAPVPWQNSSGIPEATRTTVRTMPFNDLELLERLFADQGRRIAAVIVEPMLGNAFGIMPQPGFLEGLRRLCDEYGSVLIFDEVKTGFRVSLGGAQELFGVTPDLGTFAKAMGNGFAVAAVAGRSPVIDALGAGGIGQAGTYSGNGVAVAAAKATIGILSTGEPYDRIDQVGTALMEGIRKVLADRGVPGHVTGHPAMFSIFLAEEEPTEFRHAVNHDEPRYEEICAGLIHRGVMPCPDALEPWFTSSAHTDEDVALTLQAFDEALADTVS